ncbi:thioredoxin family protein [Snuella sedimenti]|uniref:Thioredoxin family protein n=1 Tax=Snuella sedimenti TaxID=2798802 RepID=A0A8J7IU51_9FLAO|nr:thioredoxin family protein [Snuella sedimenti]MBJ6368090.1 thioredoxin family protein [Snuella sedimenti]
MKTAIKLILVMILIVCMSSFTYNVVNEGYKIGDVVDDFSLKNINGEKVSLADYKDAKGYIVIFTCNTCPYAVAYEDRINQLNEIYVGKGYPVIAIMPNNPQIKPGDSFKAMQERAKKKGFTFPYLMDEGQTVYPKFGATKTPHVFVLQKEKNVPVVKYIGAIDDNYKDANAVKTRYVEDAVNALLKGAKITNTETKAIGCTIR